MIDDGCWMMDDGWWMMYQRHELVLGQGQQTRVGDSRW
jgi:hypothetical protein